MSTTNLCRQETKVSDEVEISDAAFNICTPEGQQNLEHHKEKFMKLWRFWKDNEIENCSYPIEINRFPEDIDVGYALVKWLREQPDISGYIDFDDNIIIRNTWSNLWVPPELRRYGDRDLRTSQGQQYYQHHQNKFMKLWRFCRENNIKSFEYGDMKIAYPNCYNDNASNDAGNSLIRWLRREPDIAGYIYHDNNTIFVKEKWCNDNIPSELHHERTLREPTVLSHSLSGIG